VGRVRFDAGSVLVAYSDGLTEACDTTGSDWGEERLISAMRSKRTHSAAVLADHLLAEVIRFMADGPQQDDMTLLVARRARRGEHETRTT
jgi:sigma-B regulation protein RsbU (phosphoserine phosphatase)